MDRKTVQRWVAINAILVFAAVPIAMFSFQNCAPKVFSTASTPSSGGVEDIRTCSQTGMCPDSGNGNGPSPGTGEPVTPKPPLPPDPKGGLVLQDKTIRTTFNTPIEFTAETSGSRDGYTYGFDVMQNISVKELPEGGKIELIDAATWKVRFTPGFFRGEILMDAFARQTDGSFKTATLRLQVGNTVNLLNPALAVRGTGCVTCHAEVHSNIVTDFGAGDPFFFGSNPPAGFSWNDGLIFSDHFSYFQANPDVPIDQGSWSRLKLLKDSDGGAQKVYVPIVNIPAGPKQATGANTLRGYIQHRLQNSAVTESHSGTAIEKNVVFIGAPTAARLQTVFGWNSADETKKSKFIRNANGRNLSGLNLGANGPSSGIYFTNTGTFVCDGDVMLKGTLYLNNLVLDTREGCRLHVTGSVFVYGPITYANNDALRNLQITSAKSILMGLGSLYKGDTHCEQGGHESGYWGFYEKREEYMELAEMDAAARAAYLDAIRDSAKFRLQYHWGPFGFYRRGDTRSGKEISREIYAEMMSTVGNQMDAACRPEGRNVAYDRLLLNAPQVESRYTGGFKGSIIAEFALMSLGQYQNQSRFKFEFDPVFKNVEVLPLLKEQDFLRVE